jgi:hypothetical protein
VQEVDELTFVVGLHDFEIDLQPAASPVSMPSIPASVVVL